MIRDADASGSYYLIAGERRLRAARLAGLAEVPCIVRPAERQQMLELALVENIHRADLDPIERAGAYRDMMDRFSLTQLQVAERVGQPRATVANYLRMLDFCDEVQAMIAEGALSFGHAKVLAGLAGTAGIFNYSSTNHDGLSPEDLVVIEVVNSEWTEAPGQ